MSKDDYLKNCKGLEFDEACNDGLTFFSFFIYYYK